MTQNLPSAGIYFSQGISFVCSKSSSKVSARNSPAFKRTLSVVRRYILASAMPRASETKVTFPSSTREISYPKSVISLFRTASRPKWQGVISSNRSINYLSIPYLVVR